MTPLASELQSLIEKIKEDLAKRLSIPSTEIRLVEATQVTWPDASLGCPKMGVMYVQVVTPGFQIVLETGGKKYNYHTDTKDRVLLCPTRRLGGEITPSPYAEK
jgi:hypothetical protein